MNVPGMTAKEKSEYSIHQLVLARIMKNEEKIKYWQVRVDYWTEALHTQELKEREHNEITIPS